MLSSQIDLLRITRIARISSGSILRVVRVFRERLLLIIPFFLVLLFPCFSQKPDFKVLAFYSNKVERDHVDFSKQLRNFFNEKSDQYNFTFDVTQDWTNLNDTLLGNYQVVMWINDFPHTENQRRSFEKYMNNGGGWMGFHVAAYNDETTKWPWLVDFLGGAVFYTNSWPPIPARLIIEDPSHPIMQHVTQAYTSPTNEWYQWKPSPRENKNVKVLATLDPNNYPLGIKDILTGGDTPVIWTNTKFNMIYFNMGHGDQVLTDPMQNSMIVDGLLWIGKSKLIKQVGFAASAIDGLPEMIEVKGGTFKMGDPNGDKDENPVRDVTLKTFRIAKTEVTIGQYKKFCESTGRKMTEAPWFPQTDQHPVINVSYDMAMAYCKWLSEITGKNYRLPTEAEWEFAARGGTKSRHYIYSGAKDPDSVGWLGNKSKGTMPVATKAPNELGIYDMTGNVWEWTSDFYDKSKQFYVFRGGAWDQGTRNNRVTYRNPLAPMSRNHNKGFRVVCEL